MDDALDIKAGVVAETEGRTRTEADTDIGIGIEGITVLTGVTGIDLEVGI